VYVKLYSYAKLKAGTYTYDKSNKISISPGTIDKIDISGYIPNDGTTESQL
jgi:hypothetical protein